MRRILAYSGGYDSTYTLIRLLEEADADDEIVAVSLVHYTTGEAKLRREHESQIITIDKLRNKFKSRKLIHLEMSIYIPWNIGSAANNKGLAQPIFWISNIIPLIKNEDVVYLGYIQDDQAMTNLHEIHQMWDAALAINGNKNVKLILPNQYLSKTEVLKYLIQNYPDIVDSCISCESWRYDGRTTVCGTCEPCKHTKMALMNLIVTESGPVRDKATAMLRDNYGIEFEIHDHNGDKFEGFATRVEKVEDKEEVELDESDNIER